MGDTRDFRFLDVNTVLLLLLRNHQPSIHHQFSKNPPPPSPSVHPRSPSQHPNNISPTATFITIRHRGAYAIHAHQCLRHHFATTENARRNGIIKSQNQGLEEHQGTMPHKTCHLGTLQSIAKALFHSNTGNQCTPCLQCSTNETKQRDFVGR